MKMLIMTTLLLSLVSCGGKEHRSSSTASENVSPSVLIAQEETTTESQEIEEEEILAEAPKKIFDLSALEQVGIHIVGHSNLMELGNPPAIYCSNTEAFNFEKITELQNLETFAQDEFIETVSVDKIKIENEILLKMITKSIALLKSDPNSRLCPRIYLSI